MLLMIMRFVWQQRRDIPKQLNYCWVEERKFMLLVIMRFVIAAYNGHTETVKLLLAHSATITPEIRRMVKRKGNPQIIALLK